MRVANKVLAVYSWIVIGGLLVFLWRIAYFFEATSGQRVGHQFLILPVLLLAVGVVYYLAKGEGFVNVPLGDLLLAVGGVSLIFFGNRLQNLMTGER